ncbi:class II glutamine amidotransferase [Oscillibacter ruminantium]|uniref:class II glutamine amidotransferase n=1 Tax=Oscillibacter ruminantium TaxID=1263547 RepID=UPI0002E86915|nr:class II glutamine amidotransferase [Oscillibacter ruminantium]
MCCLFGIVDYQKSLSLHQKNRMLAVLAKECEARGTDATGIAYNSGGKLRIYKRPRPAHEMHFVLPRDANVIMGHTRMATQGSACKNPNNHPFPGSIPDHPFALAHNGVLYNDRMLRNLLQLPTTRVETDSFIAVQLLEQKRALTFDSLKYMAEQVEGSFCFSVLDDLNRLYLVKGDNPLCLYYYPAMGLYLYASTEGILRAAIHRIRGLRGRPVQVAISPGDILEIQPNGQITTQQFLYEAQTPDWFYSGRGSSAHNVYRYASTLDSEADDCYLIQLQEIAPAFGYTPDEIDALYQSGFAPEEIEEWLYSGEI